MPAKRIALFGGAFDPIHRDHLRVACECLNFGLCDEVWLVPCPDRRWDKRTVVEAKHRLAMASLAVAGQERMRVSDFEIAAGEYRGSLVLLRRFQERWSELEFRWVVGSDAFAGIASWRDPLQEGQTNGAELLRSFELILYPRGAGETRVSGSASATGPAVSGLPLPSLPQEVRGVHLLQREGWQAAQGNLSSSELRARLPAGAAEGLTPGPVLEYIRKHRLYGAQDAAGPVASAGEP